jgi:hypothetical protein
MPLDVIRAETAPYQHCGKPIRRTSPGHDRWHAAGADRPTLRPSTQPRPPTLSPASVTTCALSRASGTSVSSNSRARPGRRLRGAHTARPDPSATRCIRRTTRPGQAPIRAPAARSPPGKSPRCTRRRHGLHRANTAYTATRPNPRSADRGPELDNLTEIWRQDSAWPVISTPRRSSGESENRRDES